MYVCTYTLYQHLVLQYTFTELAVIQKLIRDTFFKPQIKPHFLPKHYFAYDHSIHYMCNMYIYICMCDQIYENQSKWYSMQGHIYNGYTNIATYILSILASITAKSSLVYHRVVRWHVVYILTIRTIVQK